MGRYAGTVAPTDGAMNGRTEDDRSDTPAEQGIVTKVDNPSHRQKAVYSLTEKGITLLPVLAQIGIWSGRYRPVSEELGATAAWLELGGPALWEQLMEELRHTHLQ